MAKPEFTTSVAVRHLPEQSDRDAGQYAFAYTVTIRNSGDVTGQLVARRWVITDANGGVHMLAVENTGNFNFRSNGIPLPYQAKIVSSKGKVRAMTTPQMNGDCNSCHTQDGANMAPGRIMAPQ